MSADQVVPILEQVMSPSGASTTPLLGQGLLKLSETNCVLWRSLVEVSLMELDLTDSITRIESKEMDDPTKKKRIKAQGLILRSLTPGQLRLVHKLRDPFQVWNQLFDEHRRRSATHLQILTTRFRNLKKDSRLSMTFYIEASEDLYYQIVDAGQAMTESDLVTQLLAGLPEEEFSSLKTSLRMVPEAERSFQRVRIELLDDERLKQEAASEDKPNHDAAMVTHTPTKGKQVPGHVVRTVKPTHMKKFVKSKRPRPHCDFCGKDNHKEEDCWIKNPNKKHKKDFAHATVDYVLMTADSEDTLRLCEETHIGVEMDPEAERHDEPKHHQYTQNTIWYIDSAATCHMTNDKNAFVDLEWTEPHPIKVANNGTLYSMGIGTVCLHSKLERKSLCESYSD
jgi:hypothetical protein